MHPSVLSWVRTEAATGGLTSMVYFKGRSYTRVRGAGPCPAGFTKGQYGCKPIRGLQKTRPPHVEEPSRPRVRRTRQFSERTSVGSSAWLTNVIAAAVSAATLGFTYYGTQKWPKETAKRFKPSKISQKTVVGVQKYSAPTRYRFTHTVPSRRTFGGFKGGAIRSAAYRARFGKRY